MSEPTIQPESDSSPAVDIENSISGGHVDRLINIAHAGVVQLPPEQVLSSAERQELRNRQRMLERVRQFWVTGLLKDSLQGASLQPLGLEAHPDAVPDRWSMVVGGREPRPLEPHTGIAAVFDEVDGQLLLLGEPGGGKTTTVLELARVLLDRAEADLDLPMPVVFPLSTWATRRARLADWLVEELVKRYGVPVRIAQQWIESDRVLPLLDGLDEVSAEHRAACVSAINSFLRTRTHELLAVVVTCRVADYQRLPEKVELRGAVLLQPLRSEQIDAYLASAGGQLAGVRAAIQADATLRELATSPVLLTAMTQAYRGLEAASLPQQGTIEQRREQLFATYVETMFSRHGGVMRFSRQQTLCWLNWLARSLSSQAQTVLYLEYLQPEWLWSRAQQLWYTGVDRLGGGLVVALLFGIVGGIAFGLDFAFSNRGADVTTPGVADGRPLGVLAVGLDQGLAVGLAAGLVTALFGGVARRSSGPDRVWRMLRGALLGCIVVGLGSGLIFRLQLELTSNPGEALRPGLLSGLGAWLFFGLMGGLAGALTFGDADPPYRPHAWPWLPMLAGLVLGVVGGLIHGLIYGVVLQIGPLQLVGADQTPLDAGLRFGTALGLMAGLVGMLLATIGPWPALRDMRFRWLASRAVHGWLLSGLTCGIVAGLGFGFISLLAAALGPGFRVQPELGGGLGTGRGGGLGAGGGSGLASGLGSGLLFGLMGALAGGLSGGLGLGLSGGPRRISVVETVGWSTRDALRSALGGLIAGSVLGTVAASVFPMTDRVVLGPTVSRGGALLPAPNNVPIFAFVFGMGGAVAFGLTGGFAGRELETRVTPNQGIHRSARAALLVATLSCLVFSLLGALAFAGSGRLAYGLLLGPALALPAALAFGGYACMSHTALRLVLWRNGSLPLDAVSFLDFATERIFLRRVGGGYIFVHRLLQDYFARRLEDAPQRSPARSPAIVVETLAPPAQAAAGAPGSPDPDAV
jgi:hypothetical protein